MENPNIIGITNQYSAQLDNALSLARLAKEVNNDIVVVAGGPHASIIPQSFFTRKSGVDIVIKGEGEQSMLELVLRLKSKTEIKDIPGVMDRQDPDSAKNPNLILDLDQLPLPAYHLVDMEKYFDLAQRNLDGRPVFWYPGVERSASVITSRGCPYGCVFCSVYLHMGRKFRKHSAEYVIRHIDFLIQNYGIRHIHFEDDNLILDKKRFNTILEAISEKV